MGSPIPIDGKTFGHLIVIGDTGKRDNQGNRIMLVRQTVTGSISTASARALLNGTATGTREEIKKLSTKWKHNIAVSVSKHKRSDNKSGVIGVRFVKQRKKWDARLKYGGKYVLTAQFNTYEEAVAARKAAEHKYLGGN
ncbi:hypothetical protein [Lacticaseibacillus paracasei]|uniref:hypothetical protein n=1 Tax=Lacticaseibacillus paracasei TaxID=1597 RepID=UPI00308840C8|nr:hypothetical protein SGY26_10830 [Lacticaseibacillus paracasei]WQG46302.1 hypothetical protein U2Q69_09200 [Lacticaseibacillus casei]